MTVGLTEMSLTRNMPLNSLAATARDVTSGMTVTEVAALAESHGAESATSWLQGLFVFNADGRLVEDLFVRTAKAGAQDDAEFLAWAAMVWSEPRIARIVETVLTDASGHFDEANFDTEVVQRELEAISTTEMRKPASSLLNRMAQAHIYEPAKHGGTIVGVDRLLPTRRFAALLAQFLAERLRDQVGTVVAERGDPVELALLWKANRWLGLTQDEFRGAARPQPTSAAPSRPPLPPGLVLLDDELRRRGQVVLQGAPGVGKTYVAMDYIAWATGARVAQSHLSRILDDLPAAERTPVRVAEHVQQAGLTALWDLTQFHPSYGYEDFVRTLAPHAAAGGVTFRPEHRTLSFLAAVGVALADAGSSCDVVLVVDEINRADIPRVFGELLYALEYRGAPVRTPYAVDGNASMTLPENLLLIGTMNTADRSIALIDYALRRRFTFIGLKPERSVVEGAAWVGEHDRRVAVALFDQVQTLFTGGGTGATALAVGHSYFLPSAKHTDLGTSLRDLARRFAYEVEPLLAEYAAEGLIDAEALNVMLVGVGVGTAPASQNAVEEQVFQWLQSS